MSLQDAFYVVGIIFMGLSTLILVAMVLLLYYIKKRVTEIADMVQQKLYEVMTKISKPIKKAADITSAIFPGNSGRHKHND